LEDNSSSIRYRSYTSPVQVDLLQHQLDETVKAISIFEDLFDLPLPLEKLDSCAIPERPSAMENLGLILYDTGRSFVDENTTLFVKQDVTLVVFHENAHNWFIFLLLLMFFRLFFFKKKRFGKK
jgi:aminopeptidase N